MTPRVFVTGAGIIAAGVRDLSDYEIALDVGDGHFQPAVFQSDAGIVEIRCGQIEGFPAVYEGRQNRFAQLGVAVTRQLLSGVDIDDVQGIGLILGTSFGPTRTSSEYLFALKKLGPRKLTPSLFPLTMFSTPVGLIGMECGIAGPSTVCVGHSAMLLAYDLIRAGSAKRLIAIDLEELSWLPAVTYSRLGMVAGLASTVAGRPFDPNSEGPVLGEIAAALLIESDDAMVGRGATPFAEIVDYGAVRLSTARADPWHDPNVGSALSSSMRTAIHRSRADLACFRSVFTSANGAPNLDSAEEEAVGCLFKELAHKPSLLSVKAVTGETLGGGLTASCIAAITRDSKPFTLESKDATGAANRGDITATSPDSFVLCNDIGVGGDCLSVVLRQPLLNPLEVDR